MALIRQASTRATKYITAIANRDTTIVVWVADGHGKSVLEQFYKGLSKEQLASIKIVSGDAARWITECANEPAHSASAVSIHSMSLSGPQMCWMKSAKTAGVLLCDRAKQLPARSTLGPRQMIRLSPGYRQLARKPQRSSDQSIFLAKCQIP